MTKIMGDTIKTITIVDESGEPINLDVLKTEQLLKETKLTLDLIQTQLSIVTDQELKETDIQEA
jgi:hypothetical protein